MLREHLPLLSAAAESVGDPQVRHRGTLAGSLAHGDPASDLPAAVLALGGTITVQGPGGTRPIAADDFFLGFLETALAPDEMITELRFPARTGVGWAFEKFNKRAQDWAIVGVAAVGGDRPGRGAREHGVHADPGRGDRGRAASPARDPRRPPRSPTPTPTPAPT